MHLIQSIVLEGHNLALLGQAGTGKTHQVQLLHRLLSERGKKVQICCTTGTACKQYKNASTLHRLFRIFADNVHSNVQRIRSEEELAKSLQQLDCLFIDEVSMLSAVMLQHIHEVCVSVRGTQKPFGGLQVVLVGDFFQLPPVPDTRRNDPGDFAFTAEIWTAFPHAIVMNEVFRQTEGDLIKVVNNAAKGNLTDDCMALLNSLEIPDNVDFPDFCHLFATNNKCDMYNMQRLYEAPGSIRAYMSEDCGTTAQLRCVLAPHRLLLKIGAPVMLLRNLSPQLTNGTTGVVQALDDDGPVIAFDCGLVQKMEKIHFSGSVSSAYRVQYGVKPSYGITIHKSQGNTLQSCVIDCSGISQPGQLGVALGRCTNTQGLKLKGFTRASCIKQPDSLGDFYSSLSISQAKPDCQCCVNSPCNTVPQLCEQQVTCEAALTDQALGLGEYNTWMKDFQIRSSKIKYSAVEGELGDVILPEGFEPAAIAMKCMYTGSPLTQFQLDVNTSLTQVKSSQQMITFTKKVYKVISLAYRNLQARQTHKPQSDFTEFYSKIHIYSTSETFLDALKELFQDVEERAEIHSHLGSLLLQQIRKFYLVNEAAKTKIAESESQHRQLADSLSNAQRARARYLAGYCIGKISYKIRGHLNKVVASMKTSTRAQTGKLQNQLTILQSCRTTQIEVLQSTNDPESLTDIERRQNIRKGLTHVTDEAQDFFLSLLEIVAKLETFANMRAHGEQIYHYVTAEVSNNVQLFEKWVTLLTNDGKDSDVKIVFDKVVNLFCKVMTNQLRVDYVKSLDQESKKKTKPLRKELADMSNKESKPVASTKRKSKRLTKDTPSISCPECQQIENLLEDEEWIQCDKCNRWYHRFCAGLFDHQEWLNLQKPKAKFSCHYC